MSPHRPLALAFALSTLLSSGLAAQERSFWTAERLAAAEALEMPVLDPSEVPAADFAASPSTAPGEKPFGHPASPPRLDVAPDLNNRLFVPRPVDLQAETESLRWQVEGDAGTSEAPYTSSRLIPHTADLAYPYRAVGRLFLQTPDGPLSCSGAVIAPRLVLTAAHCVHNGSAFYTQLLFVPALRDGVAPFGSWSVRKVHLTPDWLARASSPHETDYAILEMKNLQGRRIGDVVGWLGVQTKSLYPNHVHMLGYPRAYDGGQRMHQVTSQSYQPGYQNTVLYGSDLSRGSSGGPWIQNFGEPSDGQTAGANGAANQIVGLSSYTLKDHTRRVLGSSIPDERYTALYTAACARHPANCGSGK